MIVIAVFNNKGGVGKTSLVYHLGWLFSDYGYRVLLADVDPQANLTAMCLPSERIEELWTEEDAQRKTVFGSLKPIQDELGDFNPPHIEALNDQLALLPGDLRLAFFEDKLVDAWRKSVDRDQPAARAISSLFRLIHRAGKEHASEIALIDVGPSLGALNRSSLLAADWLVIPLGADLFSLQALRNIGFALREWRTEWSDRFDRLTQRPLPFDLPKGRFKTAGYVVMQSHLYLGKSTIAYNRWQEQIPNVFAKEQLGDENSALGVVRHFHSLMPLAQRANKPIFHLTTADGALGGHYNAAKDAQGVFQTIAANLAKRIDLEFPKPRSTDKFIADS